MALKDSRGGREYDKFIADGSGDTALRVTATSSVTTTTSGGTIAAGVGSIEQDTAPDADNPGTEILGATDVAGKERVGIQCFNLGGGSGSVPTLTFKVWGTLVGSPTETHVAPAAGTAWTQIGDDITVGTAQPNAYRAIATTPIKSIAVTCVQSGADAGDKAAVYIMAD